MQNSKMGKKYLLPTGFLPFFQATFKILIDSKETFLINWRIHKLKNAKILSVIYILIQKLLDFYDIFV